jgi:hypothetical protein
MVDAVLVVVIAVTWGEIGRRVLTTHRTHRRTAAFTRAVSSK